MWYLVSRTTNGCARAAFATWNSIAIGEGEEMRVRPVTAANANYFEFFDARPALGRFFTAQEDSIPMGTPVVVRDLGRGTSRSRLTSGPGALAATAEQ